MQHVIRLNILSQKRNNPFIIKTYFIRKNKASNKSKYSIRLLKYWNSAALGTKNREHEIHCQGRKPVQRIGIEDAVQIGLLSDNELTVGYTSGRSSMKTGLADHSP